MYFFFFFFYYNTKRIRYFKSPLQFELVRPTSIQSMVVGGATMMLISFLFIPNVLCSLWVAFSIVSIELGVVGYMALWSVNLDSISMVNLIMCIGFSVDFTAHICYAYMSSKADGPEQRVRDSLYALGLPIVQGAVSTVLGVSALVLAGSYIFMVFFKMIFLVIVFGALHGMFLLPVLLSLFGPGACSGPERRRRPSADPRQPADKSLPRPYTIPHPSLLLLHHPQRGQPDLAKPYRGNKHVNKTGSRSDKDMGLGTSEESSESSSSKSQQRRRKEAAEDEAQRRKYMEGWRKATGHPVPHQHHGGTGYPNNGYFSDEDRTAAAVARRTAHVAADNYGRPTRPHYQQHQQQQRPYRNDGRYH